MNSKKEKEDLKKKKLIAIIIFVAMLGISTISGIKDDINRVKDKIIKLHGYSTSFNDKNLEQNIEKI